MRGLPCHYRKVPNRTQGVIVFVLAAAEGSESVLGSPTALLVILPAAFALPLLAKRLRVPEIVLLLLYGVLIGPGVLNVIPSESDEGLVIRVFAILGLLLLMFLAGLEIDFDRLVGRGVRSAGTEALVILLIPVAAWFGSGFLDVETVSQRAFLTLILSSGAMGIVMPTLRNAAQVRTPLGRTIINIALITEFGAIVGITLLVVYTQNGLSAQLLYVPLLFVVAAVVLLGVRWLAWWYPEWFDEYFSDHDPQELGMRASLALLFAFVGMAILMGIESIMGAFLAGFIIGAVFREIGPLHQKLEGIAFGFFVPVFFINVGIQFPLAELGNTAVAVQAAILVPLAIAVKLIPSLALGLRFTMRESTAAGFLLSGQLSVAIALASVGVSLGLLPPALEAGVVFVVAATAVVSPIAFNLVLDKDREEQRGPAAVARSDGGPAGDTAAA